MKFLSQVDLQSNKIVNLLDPTSAQDAATQNFVVTRRLDQFAAPNTDVSWASHKITNLLDPTGAQDAATKAYVDASASGLDVKSSVRVATTANGTLATAYANGQTVDGVTLVTGNRILLKNQTTGADNGIYTVNASGAPTRAADSDTSAEVTSGMFTFVEEGTANANAGFVLTTPNPITLGTTSLTFTQFSGAGSFIAGAGLLRTGSTIDVVATDTSLTVAADSVGVNLKTNGGLQISSGLGILLNGATLTLGASGLSVTANTFQPLDATLTSLAAFNTNGLLTQTAADTFTGRTLTGTSNRITITNGDGVSGNPTADISSAYVGQATITTLGTITTGVWTGTTIAVANGGTGATTAAGARANLGTSGLYSSATHSSGTTISIPQSTHGLAASRALEVFIDEVATGDQIITDVNISSGGDVTVTFGASVSANSYRITIVG